MLLDNRKQQELERLEREEEGDFEMESPSKMRYE
jgi:hypothetical protein